MNKESLTFRPLRRVKKLGKIVVSSYTTWNAVRVADSRWDKISELTIDTEYHSFPKDEYVYNHLGEQLFFYDYNPNAMPVYASGVPLPIDRRIIIDQHGGYAISYGGANLNYCGKGLDCEGTPTFSHYTMDYVAEHNYNIGEFEPLTVNTVIEWYGWFLLNLKNTKILTKGKK